MTTMNISLPDELKEFVEAQVSERGYGTNSEFVRDLIRREQSRARVRALVVEGMASPEGSEMDAAYFDRLRERAHGVQK
ncbi:type II toxin-antitoxin system ParD family antitoxin [Microbacterium horticulturae]|uniref:Type II toxin-antitoxin system ParD family antitoxin n=1 Tax=Microbacterium horticulturae TaxID=3028316 RepID=A0ABY8BXV0_9MICO|nr:type II toxin-antitoxin system ParD family antitoxin [Microbacterium sp. KACC 23027]WEG07860.1 type II toxin-antitoxin system ParD family antitoxin [Microbacterium sp. KACC 23027]